MHDGKREMFFLCYDVVNRASNVILYMIIKGRKLRRGLVVFLLLAIYPLWVCIFTWVHVARAEFPGGRNGPLDAYRHSLASAVVSHTLGEWAVSFATFLLEWGDRESNVMDRHNNRIGARIGAGVSTFREIEPAVRNAVGQGRKNSARDDEITWLPEKTWSSAVMW